MFTNLANELGHHLVAISASKLDRSLRAELVSFTLHGLFLVNLQSLSLAERCDTRPGKHTKNYGKSPFLMGKLTRNGKIHHAIHGKTHYFDGDFQVRKLFDITRGYIPLSGFLYPIKPHFSSQLNLIKSLTNC